MIELKLNDLLNSAATLKILSTKSLKGKTAYKIARILREAEKELILFNETRLEIIKKYGKKKENDELITDENGDCIIKDEYINVFNEEIDELLNNKIEINVDKIKIDELDELNFTPSEIINLEAFIEE